MDFETNKIYIPDQTGFTIWSPDDRKRLNDITRMRQNVYSGKNRVAIEDRFCWVLYTPGYELLSSLSLSSTPKAVYLSTFMTYKNFLTFDNNKAVHAADLSELLSISASSARSFREELSNSKEASFRDNIIFLSKTSFRKGNMTAKNAAALAQKGLFFTKLYVGPTRQLYERAAGKHKQLGYLFKCIPFLHRKYNVLCHDPWEDDITKIEPLSPEELCMYFDYTIANHRRFTEMLTAPTFSVGGYEQKACVYAKVPQIQEPGFFFNPRLCYADIIPDSVEALDSLDWFLP